MHLFSNINSHLFLKMKLLLLFLIPAVVTASGFYRSWPDIQKAALKNKASVESGGYLIFPSLSLKSRLNDGVEVFCDMKTDGGGWTVIQRRRESDFQPHLDFYRNWAEYASGFGHITDSFWLGLDLISKLTNAENCKLRIDMMDWDGVEKYAEYGFFQVANSTNLYKLAINGFSGSAGDSLSGHNSMAFSTKDKDNDTWGDSCAVAYHGGWWYSNCHTSNLNGNYGDVVHGRGINWHSWHGHTYSLKRVEMKIRSVDYKI